MTADALVILTDVAGAGIASMLIVWMVANDIRDRRK